MCLCREHIFSRLLVLLFSSHFTIAYYSEIYLEDSSCSLIPSIVHLKWILVQKVKRVALVLSSVSGLPSSQQRRSIDEDDWLQFSFLFDITTMHDKFKVSCRNWHRRWIENQPSCPPQLTGKEGIRKGRWDLKEKTKYIKDFFFFKMCTFSIRPLKSAALNPVVLSCHVLP